MSNILQKLIDYAQDILLYENDAQFESNYLILLNFVFLRSNRKSIFE
uniref:Uncharacterized protein n=1 Tax=Lepeophtheirus salmonis TaxID=72036 RepID=A0A0K2U4Q3_LEPSM